MSLADAERLARALLYEGYCLYPYRKQALKNRFRWTFGTLYPPAFAAACGERSGLHAECIVRGATAQVRVELRFLQPVLRADEPDDGWQEATEHMVLLHDGPLCDLQGSAAPMVHEVAAENHGMEAGTYRPRALRITVSAAVEVVAADASRLVLQVENADHAWRAPPRRELARSHAALSALAGAHLLLHCRTGSFASALDPPLPLLAAVHDCRNDGVWPALVGDPMRCDTLLFSPIILADYPRLAPESPGDFFDSTEIDAMLTLRLQTLSDVERRELARGDRHARDLLARVDALGRPDLQRLHGAWRSPGAGPSQLRPGDRVRLWPRAGRDVFDLALRAELATVVGVERDAEGRVYCAVTVDRDPGRDLGRRGMIAHRFYFEPDELERLA